MAPVFDNNQALLPYAEDAEFERLNDYLDEKGPRIGTDFIQVAKRVMTPAIRADLINLKGFKFSRDHAYNLSEKRLGQLEQLVNRQIQVILAD